jgi:hypothetical protein
LGGSLSEESKPADEVFFLINDFEEQEDQSQEAGRCSWLGRTGAGVHAYEGTHFCFWKELDTQS